MFMGIQATFKYVSSKSFSRQFVPFLMSKDKHLMNTLLTPCVVDERANHVFLLSYMLHIALITSCCVPPGARLDYMTVLLCSGLDWIPVVLLPPVVASVPVWSLFLFT